MFAWIIGGLTAACMLALPICDEIASTRRAKSYERARALADTADLARRYGLPWIESDGTVSDGARKTYRFPL